MNIKICDVCNKEGKMVKSSWRVGWKGDIKLDVCDKHKDFCKGKTKEEVAKFIYGF